MTYNNNSNNMNHSKMIFMILLTISIVTVLLLSSHQSITAYGKTTKDDSSGKTTTSTDKKDHETTNKITHHTVLPDEGHLLHIKVDKPTSTADNTNTGSNVANQQKSNKDNGDNTIPVITDDKTKLTNSQDKTKDISKDMQKIDTDTTPKNTTSGSNGGSDNSKGSSDTGNNNSTKGGNTTTGTGGSGGGKPVVTNDTKPIPDKYGPCGPAMILDKIGNKCILDKNCQYKDVNQTIISCYNVKTRNIVIHESNNYNSHSSSKTTINNNNNNYVTNNNPQQSFFGSSLLSNNIFRTTSLNTALPQTLLLLDSKQLFDIAGDTNNSAIQSLFCTTSFKTVYSAQTKNWFVTGVVQNINTLGEQPTTELSNIQVYASFFDKDGNPISTIQNIAVEPNTLAHDQEGRFTFTAGLDTDLLGVMPTFVAISYNVL